ncbi:hypothetical protein V8C86DRAFT_2550655 [Haematococcus lacustris]
MPIALAMLASAAAESTALFRARHMDMRCGAAGPLGASTASSSGTRTTWDHTSAPTTTVSSSSSNTSGCSCSRSARKLLLVFTLPGLEACALAAAARAAGLPVYCRLLAFCVTRLGSASRVDTRRSRRALRPTARAPGGWALWALELASCCTLSALSCTVLPDLCAAMPRAETDVCCTRMAGTGAAPGSGGCQLVILRLRACRGLARAGRAAAASGGNCTNSSLPACSAAAVPRLGLRSSPLPCLLVTTGPEAPVATGPAPAAVLSCGMT